MIYKGYIMSAVPCKGYCFIRPSWAMSNKRSAENIYCYYASEREKGYRRCYLQILDEKHPERRVESVNKKGELVVTTAGEPQVVYFEAVWQLRKDKVAGVSLMAINLVDENNVEDEEVAEAEKNLFLKPSLVDEQNLAWPDPVRNDDELEVLQREKWAKEYMDSVGESMDWTPVEAPNTTLEEEQTPVAIEEVLETSYMLDKETVETYSCRKVSKKFKNFDETLCKVKQKKKMKNKWKESFDSNLEF